jgi:hypothetical protein
VGRGGTLGVVGLERPALVTGRVDAPQNRVEVVDVPFMTLAYEVPVGPLGLADRGVAHLVLTPALDRLPGEEARRGPRRYVTATAVCGAGAARPRRRNSS